MFHPRHLTKGTSAFPQPEITALCRFIADHLDALHNASDLLAGRRGRRVIDAIVDGLRDGSTVERRTWQALRDLLGILTLEHVHDETREEASLFAQIDPCDPVVAEICLLTDALRQVLEPLVAEQPDLGNHLMSAA